MDMKKMMKQAQQMQSKMSKMQEQLADETVDASVGGGVVTVTVNGKQEVVDIDIEPDAVDPDDAEMLEDLILAATNEAMRKVQDMVDKKMGQLTGGMNIPGMF
ncbi:DNA-binding protein, YbaB/EbfC family [Halobacteroides halobius DSM 5150]|uniref:Nucleoid-associated protein Halha_0047 n=1 Tax=Halobacteroides halobius (strain ATCC 35273 / DSM 5150 / MD-1) TaxID=748449 RepID=L0K7G8_HALHC|nr:YbaB/EbfC family nucleoid-associated protein [Halobacteroides halobius]AGB40068.1 DNA-binding protein, YbaB/EbfC family [Halobacteroides halobius DSM 5150]